MATAKAGFMTASLGFCHTVLTSQLLGDLAQTCTFLKKGTSFTKPYISFIIPPCGLGVKSASHHIQSYNL